MQLFHMALSRLYGEEEYTAMSRKLLAAILVLPLLPRQLARRALRSSAPPLGCPHVLFPHLPAEQDRRAALLPALSLARAGPGSGLRGRGLPIIPGRCSRRRGCRPQQPPGGG